LSFKKSPWGESELGFHIFEVKSQNQNLGFIRGILCQNLGAPEKAYFPRFFFHSFFGKSNYLRKCKKSQNIKIILK